MYKAEFRLKLTLPDGTTRERAFEHSDADLTNLSTMFVEAIFARGTTVAESMFEALEQEEAAKPPVATPPPPLPPAEKERSRRGRPRKEKDAADGRSTAKAGGAGRAPAPAVEPGTAEKDRKSAV